MVKIAVAGGSGQVAKEVIDALLGTNKHHITVLSRSAPDPKFISAGVHWCTVDYNDHDNLTKVLRGTHTILSFLQLLSDPESRSQKRLIDAAIAAKVKRFAPSEFGSAGVMNMPWWTGKAATREYLKEVNMHRKVLEYTLFQPGLFLDYLAFPHKTTKHIDPLQSVFDFQNCRAIVVEGHENAVMTLTSAADVAAFIGHAIDFEGEWPEVGGIRGNRVTFSQVIEMGERIRGRPFIVQKVKIEDLERGVLNTSWGLDKKHAAVTEEQHNNFARIVPIGILLSSVQGAWDVSNNFNQLFKDLKVKDAEEFLSEVWNNAAE